MTSTTLQYEAMKQKIKQSRIAHQRHVSVESNSTVTAHDHAGVFADFDDAVSIDDSNFQGDDEDSVADSYIDDASVQETISPAARESSFNPNDPRYSTPLSRRAEEILANAKQRLIVSVPISLAIPERLLNVRRQWKAIFIGLDHRCPQWVLIQHLRRPLSGHPLLLTSMMIKAIGSSHMDTIGYRVNATVFECSWYGWWIPSSSTELT
jgi:hypothetical protein